MARLPTPGADQGNWGAILNDFLSQTLKPDGTIRDNTITANAIAPNSITNAAIASDAVNAASIADGSITETLLSTSVQTKLNASAGSPSWNDISDKPAVIAAGATQTDARTAIGAGTSNLVIGTTATTAKAGNYSPAKSDLGLANVDNTSDINKPISTATQTALDAKADLVNGVIPTGQLPAISLTSVRTVADQATMLTLTTTDVQPGDIAVRTDGAGTYVLTDNDPSLLANWTRLNAPTDVVTSVNGHVGVIVLGKTDIGLTNVDNTSDLTKPISTATQTALDAKADLVNGTIPSNQLPALALTSVVTVASQSAMLALTSSQVQPGDIAVRSDGAGTFILTGVDPSQLANWVLLSTPTDSVTSVNGQMGSVNLTKTDIGLANVDNTSDATKNSATATLTNKTISGAANTLSNIPLAAVTGLATVAGTGSYNDLANKPTIPVSGTTAGTYTVGNDARLSDMRTPTDGSVSYAKLSASGATTGQILSYNGTALAWTTPAAVTKTDIGLANVDNTSDATKNTATATLTNKTIDGTNNTLQNIPQSAISGLPAALLAKRSRFIVTVASSVTLDAVAGIDYVVFVDNGGAPTLPTAVGNTNKYTVKNIYTASCTIATTSSQTIEGSVGATLAPNVSIDLLSDGTNWRII